MKTISAKFTGISQFWRTGERYLFEIYTKPNGSIEVYQKYSQSKMCVYSNVLTFLENWDDIKNK